MTTHLAIAWLSILPWTFAMFWLMGTSSRILAAGYQVWRFGSVIVVTGVGSILWGLVTVWLIAGARL